MRAVTADTHTWLAARQFLLDRCDDFCRQLLRVRESFEPEAIHDLRVSSRRLREGISIFSACFRKRRLAPIIKELKRLTAMLGAIRNSDEAILFFSPLGANGAADYSPMAVHIVAGLAAERAAEKRQLKKELKKMDPAAFRGRLEALCSKPRIFGPAADVLFQPVGATILAAVALREKTILDLLPAALLEEHVTAQHRLRIAVKRFRYRLEFLAPLARGDYKRVYNSIKEYQEILGDMHDLDVFSGLAGDQGENSPLKKIISARRHALFAAFLRQQAANPLDKAGDLVRALL